MCVCSDEQQHLERMLMQQWKELPEEMMGRRKGSKKADAVGAAELLLDAAACEGEEVSVEQDFFCEACKKFFKSEQQMCDVPRFRALFYVAYTLCMQQHIASKKHKEKQLEWEDLLLETHGDPVDVGQGEAEEEGAPAVLHDSDEEFEAQLARMHVGGEEEHRAGDGDSAGPSAVAAAASGSDEEEETSVNFGKKKKKKKAKRGVMSDAALFDEVAVEDAAPSVPDDGSDDKECDAPAPGKKLTKKQIRR
jgi:hypothetical protein